MEPTMSLKRICFCLLIIGIVIASVFLTPWMHEQRTIEACSNNCNSIHEPLSMFLSGFFTFVFVAFIVAAVIIVLLTLLLTLNMLSEDMIIHGLNNLIVNLRRI